MSDCDIYTYVSSGKKKDNGVMKNKFLRCLSASPGGKTPLCKHIIEIAAKVEKLEAKLRQRVR